MKKEYYFFKRNLKVINIVANLLFIAFLIFTLVVFPYIIIGFFEYSESFSFCLLFLPIMMLYFGLHEIFHAIGYLVHGAKLKKLTFGIELEKGVFYCLCKQDISKKNILNSVMYPLFYIGIVTYVIGLVFNLPLLTILSMLNISGAAADIMYFIFIVKLPKDIKFSELDDGTSFARLSDQDVSLIKHTGLEFIGKQKNIERKDFTRLKVSKLSYIVLAICLLMAVSSLFI